MDAGSARTCTPRMRLVRARALSVSTWSPRGARPRCSPTPSALPWSLTEQGTRVADSAGGVTEEAWLSAAKHYNEDQLCALVLLISWINAMNRLNVITQQPAGDYQPGQFG